MIIGPKDLVKNRYESLSNLRKIFGIQELSDAYGYIRISGKGNFDLFDYDCGVYWVSVRTVKINSNYLVLFTVGSADDGLWWTWSKYKTEEACKETTDKIRVLMNDLNTLPTDVELNRLLSPFGLYGGYEL